MNQTELVWGIKSDSSSPTDIWIVRDKKDWTLLVAKIFSRDKSTFPYSELLEREKIIYQKIKKELIEEKGILFFVNIRYSENYISPFELLRWASSFSRSKCLLKNLIKNIDYIMNISEERVSITENMNCKIGDSDYSADFEKLEKMEKKGIIFGAIVTEMIQGGSFSRWIIKNPLKLCSEIMAYLFFAIFCLAEKGINQNDLHWSNILVETKGPHIGKEKIAAFMGKFYSFEMKEFPVLFDFDRAAIRGEKETLLKKNCQTFHKKRDIVKTMCSFHHYCSHVMKKYDLSNEETRKLREIQKKIIKCLNNVNLVLKVENDSNCRFKQPFGGSLLCSDDQLDKVRTKEFIVYVMKQNCSIVKKEWVKKNFTLNDIGKNIICTDFDSDWVHELLY